MMSDHRPVTFGVLMGTIVPALDASSRKGFQTPSRQNSNQSPPQRHNPQLQGKPSV